MILVTLTCQTQSWYTLLLRMSIQRSLFLPALSVLSSCENQVPKVSGVENYRKNLETEGISSNAAKLVSISRRPDSIAVYESVWNKKVTWCRLQQIDPVCAPLWKRPTISNYKITPLFYFIVPQICRWKASWGTSQSLCLAERFLQSKATTASLNIYLRCWISFALFEDNMSVNSQLSNSNKDLTHKLTTLIALSYAFRASSLQHLNIKFMTRNDTSYKFHFHKLHKSWRKGKALPTV